MTERGGVGSRTTARLEALAEAVARKDVYIVGASDDTLEWLVARCVAAEEALRAFFAEYDDESVWIDCPSDETEQKMRDALAGVDKPA